MQEWLAPCVPLSDLPHYMEAAAGLAATVASNDQNAQSVIRSIIGRVTISRTGISVALSDDRLRVCLGLNSSTGESETPSLPRSQRKKNAVQITSSTQAAQQPSLCRTS